MAPRVEDARDRLVAMNRPVPEPTAAAMAESEAEEQSRQSNPVHRPDPRPCQAWADGGGSRTRGRAQPRGSQARAGAPDHQRKHSAVQRRGERRQAGGGRCRRVRPPGPTNRRAAISPPTRRCRPAIRRTVRAWVSRSWVRRRPAIRMRVVKPVGPSNEAAPRGRGSGSGSRTDQRHQARKHACHHGNSDGRQEEEGAQGRPQRRIFEQEEKEEGTLQAEAFLGCSRRALPGRAPMECGLCAVEAGVGIAGLCARRPSARVRGGPLAESLLPSGSGAHSGDTQSTPMPHDLPKAYDPTAIEDHWAEYWVREKLFAQPTPSAEPREPGPGGRALHDSAAAAQCDRKPAHGAHVRAHRERHPDALAPHARRPCSVGTGNRSRWNRYADAGGAAGGQRRHDPARRWAAKLLWSGSGNGGSITAERSWAR